MSPRKAPPPTFTQRHAESISKLKLVLIIVCLVAIPLSFWLNQEDVGSVNNRVTKIESPCKRFGPESEVCQKAFETAVRSITHRIACYIDHKSGRPFKPSCVGVHLRIEVPVPKAGTAAARGNGGGTSAEGTDEGDASEAHPGHSQPAPGDGGSTDQPSHPHAPSVPDQSGGGGSAGGHEQSGPAAGPTSPPSSSPERVTEVVHEAGPPPPKPPAETAAAPIREAVGGVVEALAPTVEGLGETAGGAVEGVEATTCELAKVLCHE